MASEKYVLRWRIVFYPGHEKIGDMWRNGDEYTHNTTYSSHARAMYIATNKMRTKKHAKDRRKALVYSVKEPINYARSIRSR